MAEHLKERMLPAACKESIMEVSWSTGAEIVKQRKERQMDIVQVMRSLPVALSIVVSLVIARWKKERSWDHHKSQTSHAGQPLNLPHVSSGSVFVMQ